jgi:hypothetical protein
MPEYGVTATLWRSTCHYSAMMDMTGARKFGLTGGCQSRLRYMQEPNEVVRKDLYIMQQAI